MIRFIRVASLLFLTSLAAAPADAQFYGTWHRPADVSYRQFSTSHFRLIYQRGLHEEAAEMAVLLEASLPEIRARVGLRRRLHVPVVLNRFTDRANGFFTPLPFRQEIEAVGRRGKILSPRFHSWFETVGPHELVHAAHAESGSGFGVGWMLRRFGPDLARSLNVSGPRGINEGLAVWVESRFRRGAGRLNHSLFEMEFRAAMLSADPWNLAQMLEPPAYTRPFDRYYHGGAHLFEYMEDRDGDIAFFRRARNFYYRFPLLGYGPALWYGTGTMPHVLGRRFRRHYRKQAESFVDNLGELSRPEVVASERGTAHRRPIWIDDHTLLAYSGGYHLRPGFYRVDTPSGRKEPVAYESIAEDFLFHLTPDSSAVLFTRYVPDVFEAIRSTAEAYRLDLSSGRTKRLTEGGRVFAPVSAPDCRIWALQNVGQFNAWTALGPDGTVERVQTFDRTKLVSVSPSPDGRRTVAILRKAGYQGIFDVDMSGEPFGLEPLVVFRDATVYDVSWGPRSEYLLFSADLGGVANIFVREMATGHIYRLTNVPFGAIEPALSPDRSTFAFVDYRHERYDLVRMPFHPTDAIPTDLLVSAAELEMPSAESLRGHVSHGSAATEGASRSEERYRPLLEVRPRVFYPFLLYQRPTGDEEDVHLGFGAGAGLEWSDPLQYWTAHTSAFYQKGTLWGRLRVRSGQFLARPSIEVFRHPSTIVVRRAEAGRVDTVRVGRDERGFGVGVRLPAVFESNVFRTAAHGSLLGEYRRERLFDDAGDTIREADDRITVRPSIQFDYRLQANPRDIVPNTGVRLSAFSTVDLWSERDRASRFVQMRTDIFLPFLRSTSTGLALGGSVHAQNRGGIVDLTRFFPRGYETETVFLGGGTYGKAVFELTQPLWYIDDGFFLLPLYFRAVFAYAFVETMQPLFENVRSVRRTVAGGGLGLQMRFGYGVDVTLRIAPVYRFRERQWGITFR